MMSQFKGSLLPVAVLLLQLGSLQADDVLCATNLCPNQDRCLKRDGPGNITFVCECVPGQTNFVGIGHDCSKNSNGLVRTFESCYGNSCRTGSFASPNYPNAYKPRDQIMMALYIPHATSIHFEFASPFRIEEGKDTLYVGKGLEVYYSVIDSNENVFSFDGKRVPSNFTLDSDTAWMLFYSDNSHTYEGFNISWTSEVDFEAPKVTFCPPDKKSFVRQGVKNQKITWDEPSVTASEEYNMTKDVPPDGIFTVGTTTVRYRFADVFENDAICEFEISVLVDDEPPVFYGCPEDLSLNVTRPTSSLQVLWVEPSAADNSNMTLIVNTTLRPGVELTGGIHEVDYVATDQFGNQGHCNFHINITILEEVEPPRAIINELLPLVIAGGLLTVISCICCLGRSVKSNHRDSTYRSNQQNNSTEPRSSSSTTKVRKGDFSLNSSTDTGAYTSSNSEQPNSISSSSDGSSGFISGSLSQSMDTLDEENKAYTNIDLSETQN